MTLPHGWELVAAEDVCAVVQSGGTPKSGFTDQPGIPFLKVYNLINQKINFTYRPQWVSVDIHNRELRKSRCYPGDVLMNIVGPPLGKVAIVPDDAEEWNINQAIALFRPSHAITKNWLYWFLVGGDSVRSVINTTRGIAGQVNISLSQCRAFQIPTPPLVEQRRIAAKLDALTRHLACARTKLDQVKTLALRLRLESLSRCFSGHTTATTLGDLLTGIEAGKNLRCEERPPLAGEQGVVKVSAVTWGRFDPRQSKTLPDGYTPPASARIRTGDLLISRANTLELVGATVLVDEEPDQLYLSDKILRLVMPDADKRWVMWFLRSQAGRREVEQRATGNQLSMRNISQEALRAIRVPYPDADIRKAGVEMIEAAFARADRLEAEATRARALLDRLEAAILAKAFHGELVPQDPNDEPASVLLDRLRAERAAAPQPKRGRARKAVG